MRQRCGYPVWRELTRSAPRLVLDPAGHTALVRKVLFTSDGTRLLSCSEDKSIKVWDIASSACVKTFRGHQGPASEGMLYTMALSPGDTYLAVGGWMKGISYGDPGLGTVRLYDFRQGRIAALLRGHASVVLNLAFSPDGRFLASASADKTVKVWDLKSRTELHTLRFHAANVYGLAISPDSSRIASCAVDGTIALWESRTGRLIQSVKGHDKAAIRVAFSPAADVLASASHDGTVKLWNGSTLDFRETVHTSSQLLHAGDCLQPRRENTGLRRFRPHEQGRRELPARVLHRPRYEDDQADLCGAYQHRAVDMFFPGREARRFHGGR